VPVAELAALEVDPVALSEVLETFGRGRLLSFDRDPIADWATVEIAHEALLAEWERLATWIDRHRADLRQRDSLSTATQEWESSGRDPDYLLIGSRLAEFDAWRSHASLQLTMREREFLEAGLERRRGEEAADAARIDQQRRLERRARSRLWGFLAAVALLAAAGTFALLSWLGSGPPDVVLVYWGTADPFFSDLAAKGFESAVSQFGLDADIRTVTTGTSETETELRRLSDQGVDLVVVGIGSFAEVPTVKVAVDHPETRYVAWEMFGEPPANVTNLMFRSEEGAYLAGAAAALKSKTGIIGFVGAWEIPIVDAFLAGYEAGATQVKPDIKVRATYLTPLGDDSAFRSPELGSKAAAKLYSEGADVIFAAAGSSGLGVFEAATAASRTQGRQLWAIGVDTDEYRSVLAALAPEGQDPTAWQPHILTSVTKQLDVAFYEVLADYARGNLAPGVRWFGLAEGGIDISYSGGFIDDIGPKLETLRDRIKAGEIDVPTRPDDTPGTQVP
jgi:basic membrane protein A